MSIPLIIEYEVKANDIYIGWHLDRNKIRHDFSLCIGGRAEGIRLLHDENRLEQTVQKAIISFLSLGSIKLPEDGSYELFEIGKEIPVYKGIIEGR